MKQVKIANLIYKVSRKAGLTSDDGQLAYGIISNGKQTIELETEFPSQDKYKEVVLHEVIHGVVDQYGIDNLITHENMEPIVSILARGLMQVFQDNPDLVKELFNGKATKSTNRR